ncbi:SH3 domain-containing protein [Magnetovibrio blakemorei]|uniref:SH3b domain-containing protein n=1 Tax=Magnetovibrio blakemorei TaxID=28181 RepID=A0A1E5Q733_9PROT|nr:SH3 domain-containing protein [Magnetovibrio blakemorei]OEJ66801.1 hypothetical protein BEN30_11250 [Magnetovibrio blakemorei]
MMTKAIPAVFLICAVLASSSSVHAQTDELDEAPSDFKIELPAASDEIETVTVMDQEVVPMAGLFEVNDDVNVRSGPGTDFERIAGLKAGDRVRAIGRAQDPTWTAISKDGETLGFVYTPILVPVVDGTLGEQFFGSYMSPNKKNGIACDYRFRFEGKVPVEGDDFVTSDYEVRFRCANQVGANLFYAHMFLTESPVDMDTGFHLIDLDVRSIGDGMEEFLSTRFLYHPKTGVMTFEGHSLPRYAKPLKVQTFKTKNIKDALTQALEASVASWTEAAWDLLLKKPQ